MASSHLTGILLELDDVDVTVRDGAQASDHDGSVSVVADRAGRFDGDVVTIELEADPAAARERAMSVSLSAGDAASLEAALAEARSED